MATEPPAHDKRASLPGDVVAVAVAVAVVVVVRSVVRQVSELRRGVVFARVPPQPLFSRLSQHTVPSFYLDQSRSHLQSCEHSWAEQTTGL